MARYRSLWVFVSLWTTVHTIYFVSMAFATMASAGDTFGHVHSDESASALDILDKNALTTAGVALAAGGVVSGGMVLTAALPVPVLGLTAVSAGLIYAGDRQAKGLPLNPLSMGKAPVLSDDRDMSDTPTVIAEVA